jgi:GT2 family glycosyltransferase
MTSSNGFMAPDTGQSAAHGPLVSVVVPTLGRDGMLRDALASLRAQAYPHWEALVVNDGGSTVPPDVLGADARRIRYVEHGRRLGPAAARNTALRLARGDIVCYLDDDDLFLPGHLAAVVEALRDSTATFVYTDADRVVEELTDGQRRVLERSQPFKRAAYSRDELVLSNFIPINAWAHRYECITRAGFFDEHLPFLEDWELLLRFARLGEFRYLPVTTVEVRHRRDRNDSRTGQNRESAVDVYREIYRRTDDMVTPALRAERDRLLVQLNRTNPTQPPKAADVPAEGGPDCYARWNDKHSPREIDAEVYAERMLLRWSSRPLAHFMVNALNGSPAGLADTLDALTRQLYPNWVLTIVARSMPPGDLSDAGGKLAWVQVGPDTTFASAVNAVLPVSPAEWVGLLEAGDTVEPHLLLVCLDHLDRHPHWRLLYTDEDRLGPDGVRGEPRFKPDFNLDLLRSTPYVGGFCLANRAALTAAGGCTELADMESYDATLKIADLCGEQAVGHVASVLYHRRRELEPAPVSGRGKAVLAQHLTRRGVAAVVTDGLIPGTYRTVYRHATSPLVSVIIPTRDRLNLFRPCVESLFQKTAYGNFELIVVDNGSVAEDTHDYYQELQAAHPGRVRILSYPGAFNFSAMNNLAAGTARGEYLLLLNNDTAIIQSEWLGTMLEYAQRPEVGIVGARLIFPDARLQHAGLLLGVDGAVGSAFFEQPMSKPGYLDRAQCDQNYSAVSGACLLVRKTVFDEIGGFDEQRMGVHHGDVDLCLKAGDRGYKIVWTPYAVIVHHGRGTRAQLPPSDVERQRLVADHEALLERWLPRLASDPAHNRHLGLGTGQMKIETEIDAAWDPTIKDRPRILGAPMDALAVGHHRVIAPLKAIEKAGKAFVAFVPCHDRRKDARVPTVVELERLNPDVLLLQSTVHESHIERLRQYKRFNRVFKVFDFEDLKTQAPAKNSQKSRMPADFKRRLREVLASCDRMTVTTEPLREAYRHLIGDIRVVPLRLERARWGNLRSRRRQGPRPRIGWAGAMQHRGDLELIIEVVKQTAREVDWVFFGMCLDELRPYAREVHGFVPYDRYPAKLASLNLDLAVAPLEYHPFNEAKTNLRLLEYGAMGWPVVCTDILPYQSAPVMRVPNDARAWIEAIRGRVHDLDATEREGDRLRQWVMDNWMLEDHLGEWLAAFTPDVGNRKIEGVVATAIA